MAESEEELKSLWMKVKGESEKVGLKLNIQKTKIMASGPITSWEVDGEIVEIVADFVFLGSKITADSDCSHEIKRRLLLGRKVMTPGQTGIHLEWKHRTPLCSRIATGISWSSLGGLKGVKPPEALEKGREVGL